MFQLTVDEIRELILEFLFSNYQNARGVKSTACTISKIKHALKQKGLKEREIVSNLDYLIQTEWVIEKKETYPITSGGTQIMAQRITYKISDKGIDHFEGISKFQRNHKVTGINITNIQGVTVVGDGNLVYNQYSDLYRSLNLLDEEIRKNDAFSDKQKLNCRAEIETIKSQLAKSEPNRGILKSAWEGLKALATVSSIAQLLMHIKALIEPLIG
jgi:hypothetical protein